MLLMEDLRSVIISYLLVRDPNVVWWQMCHFYKIYIYIYIYISLKLERSLQMPYWLLNRVDRTRQQCYVNNGDWERWTDLVCTIFDICLTTSSPCSPSPSPQPCPPLPLVPICIHPLLPKTLWIILCTQLGILAASVMHCLPYGPLVTHCSGLVFIWTALWI